jgi:hypothetical protein
MRAHVRNGYIVVDEPTNLPEGAEVVVAVVDADDDLDDAERAELEAELHAGLDDLEAGRTFDAEDVIAELRARHR